VLFLNILQRRHSATAQKKRVATLVFAMLILLFNILLALILSVGLPQWTGFIALAIVIFTGYILRPKLRMVRFTCASCKNRLDTSTFLYHDSNICPTCREKQKQEQAEQEQEPVIEPHQAQDVSEIDWETWEPDETAVLCYIVRDNHVLLINKKTGLGKGLVNAPGGRILDTETAAEAAVRETQEETGMTPQQLKHMAILNFQFTDGYAMRGHVFLASDASGELINTSEAEPFWVPVVDIPYKSMWEDDSYWLPQVLEGNFIEGRFIFDEKTMVSKEILTKE